MTRGILLLMVTALGALAFVVPLGHAQTYVAQSVVATSSVAARFGDSQWFERADGAGGFIFDQGADPVLLLDENEGGVVTLYRARAAGGGEVWRTANRRIVLRVTNLGGWTYFPSDKPDGVIVEPVATARSLAFETISVAQLQSAVEDFASRLSDLSRNEVVFEYSRQSAVDRAFFLETLAIIEDGVDDADRRAARALEGVRLGTASAAQVRFDGSVLDVSIAPAQGLSGQPRVTNVTRVIEAAR